MMPPISELARQRSACTNCRFRKVKCNGDLPCLNCVRLRQNCRYEPSRRGKRPRNRATGQQNGNHAAQTGLVGLQHGHPSDSSDEQTGLYMLRSAVSPIIPRHSATRTEDQLNPQIPLSSEVPSPSRPQNTQTVSAGTLYPSLSDSDPSISSAPAQSSLPACSARSLALPELSEERPAYEEESVIPLPKVNWEHHGPWSWVSVCSSPGLKWVSERAGNDEFVDIAYGLTKTWSRRLKMNRFRPIKSKWPEPEKRDAWRYVTAYFEQSYDAVFGILNRPSFEHRLKAFFDNQESFESEDPSWFALRNVVYATGCRSVLANDPSVSFLEAEARVGKYFQNALSVFSEITFGHTGLTAVQALALMALYAEGLGSPALEYPLCTNAVHLAQAKGLHRDPSKSWGLAELDVLHRRWLWWAIYCLDKQITFRSGRPSAIDDDNISTQIPTKAPPGSASDVEVLTLMVRHAQISSQISRRIMSVKASKQSPAQAMETVRDIHFQLESLLETIPTHLKVRNSSTHESFTTPQRTQSFYLHFAIYGSLMATHTIYFYPWIAPRFGIEFEPLFQSQVVSSSETVANAARQVILTLRSLSVDAATPAWLGFYYPMYAHINLFIYVLRNPSLPTSSSDLALLDVCAGHFGYIGHVTSSEVSFDFPRESSALCSKVIKASKLIDKESGTIPGTPHVDVPAAENSRLDDALAVRGEHPSLWTHAMGDPFDEMNFEIDSWNILSSIGIINSPTTNFGDFGEESENISGAGASLPLDTT